MNKQNIDSALPQKKPKQASKILIALSVILYVINFLLGFAVTDFSNIKGSAALYGTIIGLLLIYLLVPLFFVGLFQLHRSFRNFRSILKIFCWASLIFLCLNIGKYL